MVKDALVISKYNQEGHLFRKIYFKLLNEVYEADLIGGFLGIGSAQEFTTDYEEYAKFAKNPRPSSLDINYFNGKMIFGDTSHCKKKADNQNKEVL